MSGSTKQRWLILAHAFNMDGRAASQTITDKIPHFLAADIELVVLSGALGEQDTRFEHHRLWPWGPAGIRFELRHVLRKHLSGWAYRLSMGVLSLLLLPFMLIEKLLYPLESSWSWQFAAVAKARALAQEKPFDWIYSTGGAYAAHLAAGKLKKQLGVPWLAEVHDPFVVPGHEPRTSHEKAKLEVERQICTDADAAVWFTDQALVSAKRRHPQLGNRGHVVLPGIDDPFPDGLPPYVPGPKMIIGHFGSLSKTRSLVSIIRALEILQSSAPDALADVELQITGGPLDELTLAHLENSSVRGHVRHLGRIETNALTGLSGRTQILRRMRQADVLLLLHGQEPICEEYIPSKLYEYLWMQRPILAQVHRNPQMVKLLKDYAHWVVDESDAPDSQEGKIAQHIVRLHRVWHTTGISDNAILSEYTTENSAQKILNAMWRSMNG